MARTRLTAWLVPRHIPRKLPAWHLCKTRNPKYNDILQGQQQLLLHFELLVLCLSNLPEKDLAVAAALVCREWYWAASHTLWTSKVVPLSVLLDKVPFLTTDLDNVKVSMDVPQSQSDVVTLLSDRRTKELDQTLEENSTSDWLVFCNRYGHVVTKLHVDSYLEVKVADHLRAIMAQLEEQHICPNLKSVSVDMAISKKGQGSPVLPVLLNLLLASTLSTLEIQHHRGEDDVLPIFEEVGRCCPFVRHVIIGEPTIDPEDRGQIDRLHSFDCSIFRQSLCTVSINDLEWEGWEKLALCTSVVKITIGGDWKTGLELDKDGSKTDPPFLHFPSLRHLSLNNDWISRRVLFHSHMPVLVDLDIGALWDEDGDPVSVLCSRSPLLQTVDVRFDCFRLTSRAIRPFASLTQLAELRLRGLSDSIEISDAAICHLAESLPGLRNLSIWIRYMDGRVRSGVPPSSYPSGASLIALAEHCKELTSLELAAIVTDADFEENDLESTTALTHLTILLVEPEPTRPLDPRRLGKKLASLYPRIETDGLKFQKLHGRRVLGDAQENAVKAGFVAMLAHAG